MRTRILIFCGLVLAVCLWLLLRRPPEPQPKAEAPEAQAPLTNQLSASQPRQPKTVGEPQKAGNGPNVGQVPSRPSQTEISNLQQKMLADWQRPIEFYGKVVDENSNAVSGAQVSFHWMQSPSEDGSRSSNTESDVGGLFSLLGAAGPTLSVSISKDGYYTSRLTPDGFRYDGDKPFQPSSLDPVVFHLRKKAQGVELITSENGMRSDVWLRVPKDGTPVRVDFSQKQASPTGQLKISQNKPPFQNATNWSFSMSIPDGGLVENQDEFQFAAPESGYQPTVEYDFAKDGTNWTTQVTKQFYIAFGEPRKYGWLRIESNLAQETIFLTYAINPTGSRNLEPQ
jgi:hypothetical protein